MTSETGCKAKGQHASLEPSVLPEEVMATTEVDLFRTFTIG